MRTNDGLFLSSDFGFVTHNKILVFLFKAHQIAIHPKTTDTPQWMMGDEVTGATLGIIGMGRIGYKIAQRSRGFDMKVLYHNRKRR